MLNDLISSFFFLQLFCLAQTAQAATRQQKPQVLTNDNFQKVAHGGKNGMVKFYQPWCGHCAELKPTWDRLAYEVHDSVFIADVNCEREEQLCNSLGIDAVPTLKVFQDGKMVDYDDDLHGSHKLDALLSFVQEQLAANCDLKNPDETCSERAKLYKQEWHGKTGEEVIKEVRRLHGIKSKTMTRELQFWLNEKLDVLKQLLPEEEQEEL